MNIGRREEGKIGEERRNKKRREEKKEHKRRGEYSIRYV